MKRPEDVWSVGDVTKNEYEFHASVGRETARDLSVVVVGIARNAMPYLTNTLELVKELAGGFKDLQMYVYENDSADNTANALDDFAAANSWFHVRHATLGVPDTRGFEPDRTHRLAACRNECHDYVRRHASNTTYTIVLDLDPHYGFSVDGVFSSIYWLGNLSGSMTSRRAGAMASYSLWSVVDAENGARKIAHYDAWAARLNTFRDRRAEVGFGWFSTMLPDVGSPPIPLYSAFGGLCVYMTEAFLSTGINPYEGGDCEHVFLHKKMRAAGWQLYLNPGCRYVAHWQE